MSNKFSQRAKKLQAVKHELHIKTLELQRMAQQLKQNEVFLELFFSQSLEGFFFMALDAPVRWNGDVDKEQVMEYVFTHQRITRINDAMLQQYGLTRKEVIGLTPNDLFERGIIRSQQGWRALYEKGRIQAETCERKFDGTPMWIEGDYTCIYNEYGEITGCFGIQREITRRKQTVEALRKSEERLQHVIASISDYIYVTIMSEEQKPINLYHSPNIEALTGYSFEIFMNDWNFWMTNVVHPDDRAAALSQAATLAQGVDREIEYRLKRADGEILWVRDSGRVRRQEDGKKIVYGVISNITERKRSEELLRHSIKIQERRTRELQLLTHMGRLLQTCHTEKETYGVVITICKLLFPLSAGCLYIREHSRQQLRQANSWGDCPRCDECCGVDEYWKKWQGGTHLQESSETLERSNFTMFQDEKTVYAIISSQEDRLGVLTFHFGPADPDYSVHEWEREMDARRIVITRVAEHYALFLINLRLRETLKVEAIRDPLTGLYNRRYMETALQREMYRARRNETSVGLLLFDIDHFKHFNDTYGHPAGDALLRKIGAILRDSTRLEDIACRYGGEEFLIILPGASLQSTEIRAGEILDIVRDFEFPYKQHSLHITMSIGVAAVPNHGFEMDQVISATDVALYQAKTNGRNQVVVAAQ